MAAARSSGVRDLVRPVFVIKGSTSLFASLVGGRRLVLLRVFIGGDLPPRIGRGVIAFCITIFERGQLSISGRVVHCFGLVVGDLASTVALVTVLVIRAIHVFIIKVWIISERFRR